MKQVSDNEERWRLRELEDMTMRQLQNSAASLLAVTLACGVGSQTASAQFSSTTRTGSNSGNALTSGTATATGAAGATSGFGGAAGGAGGGAANAAVGGNNAANRTAGTGQAALGQSLFTQGNNQNGFIGGRNQQQGFVGGNQRTGQQQNNRQQQQNNRQGGFGQNDPNNMNGQGQQNQDQRRAIRPSFKVAFDQPLKPAADIRSTLQPRFDSLSQTPSLRGVAYELDAEGVVVLRGTVETPAQKRLAENVVKLEPGVKKVRNELTLNGPSEKP